MNLRESGQALRAAQRRLIEFEKRFAVWLHEAENFAMGPTLAMTPGQEQMQITLASMQLFHLVNQLQSQYRMGTEQVGSLEGDRRIVRADKKARSALWIANVSLVLAMLGFSGIYLQDFWKFFAGIWGTWNLRGGAMTGPAWLQFLGLMVDIVGALIIVKGLFISDENLRDMFTPYPGSPETALQTKGAQDRRRQVRLGRIGGLLLMGGFVLQVVAILWREISG